jgi:hypothetical protein
VQALTNLLPASVYVHMCMCAGARTWFIYCRGMKPGGFPGGHGLPSHTYIYTPDKRNPNVPTTEKVVDHVLRFENLQEDFSTLMKLCVLCSRLLHVEIVSFVAALFSCTLLYCSVLLFCPLLCCAALLCCALIMLFSCCCAVVLLCCCAVVRLCCCAVVVLL